MSSQLYKDARQQFVKDAEERYKDSKDLEMLRDFLTQNSSPEDAQAAAGSLKSKASEKWGAKKIGDVEIPELWIDRIMENIGHFVAVGNYAMTGAPESVGLAWFAVKLTLSAIQSNYELYSFFGSALTDISEIMIIIPHYDRLYDERSKAAKHEWKPSPVVNKLFQDIISAYAAVLNFSFAVKRHLGAGTLAKWRHGIKDFFGANKAKFEGKMSTIASCKKKILEDSQAIFQDKTLHQLDSVKGIVSNIEGTVSKIESFQSEVRKMHEEQAAQWALVMKNMDDIKASTKPKTPWDLALQVFEKNREALDPLNNTSEALGKAIDWRHPGTCSWIFRNQDYMQWTSSANNSVLCLNGQQDSGKSTVLATVVEQLDLELENTTAVIYLNCTSGRGASTAQTVKVDAICRTLLYVLYDRARQDENNLKLLERCNKIFIDPKQEEKKPRGGLKKDTKADGLPDFAEAYLELATHLNTNVVVALDEIDSLAEEDQQELATKIKDVVTPKSSQSLKFLIGCRSASKFFNQIQPLGDKLYAVNVGDFNDEDMKKQLTDELKNISGLTVAEQKEAAEVILQKAGPRFAYIGTIAVPFMRQPFQRPLSRRLEALPEGMSGVYSEALRKMGSNYVELLRVALKWTLLAPLPLRVYEIMDIYHGVYTGRGHEVEEEARNLEEPKFTTPSLLELEQIQDACGPFLKLEQEDSSGHRFVHLQDPQQVREFCIREDSTLSGSSSSEAHICARCMTLASATDTLIISPKEGHLQLALHCIRTMNNPIFQRRCTADDFVPFWRLPANSEDDSPEKPDHIGPDADMEPTDLGSMEDNVTIDEQKTLSTEEDMVILPKFDSGDAIDEVDNEPEDGTEDANSADATANIVNDEDLDADDSEDDEDKGDIDFSKPGEKGDEDEEDDPEGPRTQRYELQYWFYHIQQAEELWSPGERADSPLWAELFEELEFWVTKEPLWYSRWQVTVEDLIPYGGQLKPLHLAAYLGLTSWASYLLDKGADVNEAPHSVSCTPLQLAAVPADSPKMLELLLERGADPNNTYDGYLSAFYIWLTNNPELESVRLFLKHGADPTQVTENQKSTALHCFAYNGEDLEALELILDCSVNGQHLNIDATDIDGNTALHMLLYRQKVPIPLLKALMTRGADVNVDNLASTRPLQMACVYGEIDALKVLCENQEISQIDDLDDDGDTALLQAAINNYADCMKFLLETGSDPNIQNKKSRTALHEAAAHGTIECVQVLLDRAAQPNLLDKHSRTPLFWACLDSSNEEKATLILDKLLQNNVPLSEVNTLTKRHRSPVREAAGHGFERVLSKLIDTAKARGDLTSLSINERDKRKGMTPLHRAAWFGKASCVELLLSANADVTITENDNKTALVLTYEQWARASHLTAFEDIISMLITKDPNAARIDPELVAICAVNGSVRLLTQLADLGANLNGQDQYGWTPLDLAQKFQQKATSHFLKQQAAWAGMLPSRWGPAKRTWILEDGITINHTSAQRMCISTNKPLPAGLDKFYFEVTCLPLDGFPVDWYPELAIGFCTIGGSAIRYPGWPPRAAAPSARSWGYHGDDGGLFESTFDGKPVAHELPYHGGDTVGCGVDLNAGTLWFTKNGKKLESGFKNVTGRLFPLLGLSHYVEIKTNLVGPFVWPGEDGEKAIEEVEAKQP